MADSMHMDVQIDTAGPWTVMLQTGSRSSSLNLSRIPGVHRGDLLQAWLSTAKGAQ